MIIRYATFLFAFWLLLSGYLEPLMLGLGLASVALTVVLIRRMTLIDHESYPVHLSTKFPAFLIYMLKEIMKANLDVMKHILAFRHSTITPTMTEIPADLKTDLGCVIYANSITLTPGTVSVELKDNKILVHALTKDAADELAKGEMKNAVPDKVVTDQDD